MNKTRIAAAALATAGVTAATVVGSVSPAMAQVNPCVQRVVVANNAGFNLSYTLTDRTGAVTTTPTEQYASNQARATDLTFTDFAANTDVRPIVTPQGGGSPTPAGQFVSFCDNGQTATYIVTGNLLGGFQITLIGG